MALCRAVMAAHVNSVVKIGCRKRKRGTENSSKGTGFIVHMDARFCLVMTCGHVLEDHVPGSVHVSFGETKIDASVVFAEYAQEVSMVRVDRSTKPESFDTIACYPPVRWSANEAQEAHLVAILSRLSDPEKNLVRNPCVFHGSVSVAPRYEPQNKKTLMVPLHLGTADYTSVKGNSGSAIFSQALQVVGIHISAVELTARFVCLQGVALVMEEYLKSKTVPLDTSRSASVSYLLEKIVESETAAGPSSAGAGAGAGAAAGAGGSSSGAGSSSAGAP